MVGRRIGPRAGLARRAFVARFPHREVAHPHLKYLTGGYALEPEALQQYNLSLLAQGRPPLIGYDEDCQTYDIRTGNTDTGQGALTAFLEGGDSLWTSGPVRSAEDHVSWASHANGAIHELRDAVLAGQVFGGDHGGMIVFRKDRQRLPEELYDLPEPGAEMTTIPDDADPTHAAAHSDAVRAALRHRERVLAELAQIGQSTEQDGQGDASATPGG